MNAPGTGWAKGRRTKNPAAPKYMRMVITATAIVLATMALPMKAAFADPQDKEASRAENDPR
jgi:hypothetical protein